MGGEISPVYAPSGSQWTFCAYVVSPASTHACSAVYGGATIASTPSTAASREASSDGSGPANIFQLPATITRAS